MVKKSKAVLEQELKELQDEQARQDLEKQVNELRKKVTPPTWKQKIASALKNEVKLAGKALANEVHDVVDENFEKKRRAEKKAQGKKDDDDDEGEPLI